MSSGAGYVRLNSDNLDEVEMSQVGNNDSFNVTILSKEKQYPIQNVTSSMTLSEFKERVKEATDIEVIQQRLIFAGRRLDMNSKALQEYKITQPCTIHLFPIPVANLAPASSSSSSAPVTTATSVQPLHGRPLRNPMSNDDVFGMSNEFAGHTPMHFDENVSLHSREVKLWCLILMFLCIMDLMDIVSALLTDPGALFGTRPIHIIVIVLNFLVSAVGLWVAQLGLKCTQSLNLEEVKKYAMYLRVLAVAALVMRILWVFDIVQEVQKIVDDSKKAASAGASNGASSSGSPGTTANVPLDDSVVQSYTIQAMIICFICAYAWGNCVYRAIRLRMAVEEFSDSSTTATPATAVHQV